jgi:hypothetical protein
LDNLDAEMILHELWVDIGLEKRLGFVDSSRLCCLVGPDIPYHMFCEKIQTADFEKLTSRLDNVCGILS